MGFTDQLMRVIVGQPTVAPSQASSQDPMLERIAQAIINRPAPMPTDLRMPDLRGAAMLSSANMRALIGATQDQARADLAARQTAVQAGNAERQQAIETRMAEDRAIQQAIMGQSQLEQGKAEMNARLNDTIMRAGLEQKRMALDEKQAKEAGARADRKMTLEEQEAAGLAKYRADSLAQRAARGSGGRSGQPERMTAAEISSQNETISLYATNYADEITGGASRDSEEWKQAYTLKLLDQRRLAAKHPYGTPYIPYNPIDETAIKLSRAAGRKKAPDPKKVAALEKTIIELSLKDATGEQVQAKIAELEAQKAALTGTAPTPPAKKKMNLVPYMGDYDPNKEEE